MAIDPSALSGKLLWLRAKDNGADGTAVSTWTDRSGLAIPVTTTGGTAPVVVAGATPSGGKSVRYATNAGLHTFLSSEWAVDASSTYPGGYAPQNVIDGSTAITVQTVWASNAMPVWLRFHGRARVISSYRMMPSNANYPTAWTFEGSTDGTNWTVLDTRTGQPGVGGTWSTSYTFSNATAYPWYRFNFTGSATTIVNIAEIEFNGQANKIYGLPGEAWVVVRSLASAATKNPGPFQVSASPYAGWYPYNDGVVYQTSGSNFQHPFTPTVPVTGWRLFRISTDGSNWKAFLDNIQQASVTQPSTWGSTGMLGGDTMAGGQIGTTGAGALDIAEFMVFNRQLTAGEVADLITYFNTEHGLAVAGGSTGPATPVTTGTSPVTVASSSASALVNITTGTAPVGVGSSARTIPLATVTGTGPVGVGSSSVTSLVGVTPVTTGTAPVTIGSSSATALVIPVTTTTGTSPVIVESSSAARLLATTTGSAPITVGSSSYAYTPGAALPAVGISAGVKVETGPLTLLKLKALPGVEVNIGLGVATGEAQAVVPLPGVSIEIGCSLIARPVSVRTVDARGRRPQWRYVITDLANVPLGELVDLEHDPVEDGIGDPATMSFTVATASADSALIRPVERQCQVWDGDVLRLRGPILPGRPSDDGTAITYTVHDPSWFWRDGRRLITRIPQKNLLRNGDFKNDLAYWTAGYDRESKPAAAPKVRVVSEDFADDTDGLNPIKAAEIVGVESFTESELSSNAVFWPNLATFRPGGVASVEAVANAMPTTVGLKVTVVGHTANDGTGNGLKLSERRAVAAAAIIKKKRPGAVITTKGVGFYDPKKGYPIGSQAQRRVVIQYDQTISGESLQWMRQRVEVTQPKEARYPLVLTAAAMLKVADDWSIEDANMMSVKVLARRKTGAKPPKSVADALAAAKVDYQSALTHLAEVKADKNHTADQLDSARADVATAQTKVSDAQNEADSAPWDLQLGVGSASISDTDPVDRWIPQTAEATIPADGRVYVVDVYLYAPAALARYTAVGLFPEEMLYFWGQDQASIFKDIMEHIQDPAFGHGDLGVGTRTPLTGVLRDREFAFRDLTPADTALDGLTAISRGLEWDTVTTPTTTTATTYYPRQGKTVDYVLAQGGNVAVAVPANTRDVGSNVIAQAQGLGSYRAVAYARDARAFGGTLLERVVTAEQDTPLNELRETAKAELYWARTSTPAYWVDIDPEAIEDVLANTAKGDTVRLILDYPTPVDALARIVRRQIHPDSLRLMLAFEEA